MSQPKNRNTMKGILEVEHGVFTPLVFSTSGSMGREVTTFYKHLADMLALKQGRPYHILMGWLRCRIGFAILRTAITCIRVACAPRFIDLYTSTTWPSPVLKAGVHADDNWSFLHMFYVCGVVICTFAMILVSYNNNNSFCKSDKCYAKE